MLRPVPPPHDSPNDLHGLAGIGRYVVALFFAPLLLILLAQVICHRTRIPLNVLREHQVCWERAWLIIGGYACALFLLPVVGSTAPLPAWHVLMVMLLAASLATVFYFLQLWLTQWRGSVGAAGCGWFGLFLPRPWVRGCWTCALQDCACLVAIGALLHPALAACALLFFAPVWIWDLVAWHGDRSRRETAPEEALAGV